MNNFSVAYPLPVENPGSRNKIYFDFEEDFIEDNVRCIPMIVRFKLDACGIKLKLSEWSRMSVHERECLSEMPCSEVNDLLNYRAFLKNIIHQRTGAHATDLPVDQDPGWAKSNRLPAELLRHLEELNSQLSLHNWSELTNLQRFVLLKLCRPGHENRNFPIAMKEFGLA